MNKSGFMRAMRLSIAPLFAVVASIPLPAVAHAGPQHDRTHRSADREAANVKLVLAMWDGVINRADRAAVMRYIAPDYKQHNPNVAQGRDGVLELIQIIRNAPPGFTPPGRKTLLRAVAQGDFVVLIWNQPQPDPTANGETYTGQAFDMFRVKGGQVVEHWDDTRKSVRPWRSK